MMSPSKSKKHHQSKYGNVKGAKKKAYREDYQYFQLYDPDDSDLEEEDDPDVKALLANPFRDGGGDRAKVFCCSCLKGSCQVCLHKYFWLESLSICARKPYTCVPGSFLKISSFL